MASVDSCCCSSETHEGAQAETSRAHNKVEDRPWRLGESQAISTHATVAEIFQLKSTKSCFKLITKQCMQVEVLCGRDRGKQGHVAVVARKLNKVIVQGLNTVGWHLIHFVSCVIVADKSAIGHNNCVQDLECRNCHGDFSGRCVQDFILIVRPSVVVPKSFF